MGTRRDYHQFTIDTIDTKHYQGSEIVVVQDWLEVH